MNDGNDLRTSSEPTLATRTVPPPLPHVPAPTAVAVGASAKRLLTIAEFSAAYGICRSRVYEELNAGRLIGVKASRSTLIPVEAAETWAANLPRYESGPVGR